MQNPTAHFSIEDYRRMLPRAIQCAGYHLQNHLRSISDSDSDFSWIQTGLYAKSFQHLCFRFKNNIYSVLVVLAVRTPSSWNQYVYDNQELQNQIRECAQYNIIPCKCILYAHDFSPVNPRASLLFDSKHSSPVRIEAGAPAEMSAWEILDFAISIVKRDLENSGKCIKAIANVPGILPQIWFEQNGQGGYVVVNAHKVGSTEEFSVSRSVLSNFSQFKGYYAEVGLQSAEIGNSPLSQMSSWPLRRGGGVFVMYKGLVDLERSGVLSDKPSYYFR